MAYANRRDIYLPFAIVSVLDVLVFPFLLNQICLIILEYS